MHQHTLDLNHEVTFSRFKRYQEFAFAALVGVLLLLNVTGTFRTVYGIDTAAILALVAGYRTIHNAIDGLLHRRISADLAICIAVAAAFWAGEYLAAAEAMFIMLVGESLEGYAARRTAAAIRSFVEQMPAHARVLRDGVEVEVDSDEVCEGDIVVVRSGERIAADGVVATGMSSVDEASITGEPLPRDKGEGDEVFSGTLNLHGLLHIRVTRAGADTTLARVIRLIEEARERKAPVVRLADRWATFFVPALLLCAATTYYITREPLRAVAVLIVGCPCALILATPTAMVAAIGALARRGILVRGGTALQQAAEVDTVFFDKTGTVTEGQFEIIRLLPAGRSEAELLTLAATAESASDHPLARVIVSEARQRGVSMLASGSARIVPGLGAECIADSKTIRAGSAAFLQSGGIAVPAEVLAEADEYGATAVLVAADAEFAGAVLLRDRLRGGVTDAVHGLQHLGITDIAMLTGDRARPAAAIARAAGIRKVDASLLPEEKLRRISDAVAQGKITAMVGDGVNDAPALASAHVGIAVRGASDITAEAADVVYMGRSLDALPLLIGTSRRAVRIVWQNIWGFAVGLNVVAIGLAATGTMGPLQAALTHQAGSFLVMLNSLRLLLPERRFRIRIPRLPWREALSWIMLRRVPVMQGVAVLYVLSGVFSVGPDESAVVQRWGKTIGIYGSGLQYTLPWPVGSITRVSHRVRTVELGFRSAPGTADRGVYEWNAPHRAGEFQRLPEESLLLTGDSNMAEVTASVHYRVSDAGNWLFRNADSEQTIRAAAEASLQEAVSSRSLEAVLTDNRRAVEGHAATAMQQRLNRAQCGVKVLAVRLLDVHPSQETVDSYRAVSAAFEEKNRLINEAEGYRNEQVAVARGTGQANLQMAVGYTAAKRNRAAGDASRFTNFEGAFRSAPGTTETRLYLESLEQVLPGKKKVIVDRTKGRRHLVLLDNGVEIGPALASPVARPLE